jgi:hypothetical protein
MKLINTTYQYDKKNHIDAGKKSDTFNILSWLKKQRKKEKLSKLGMEGNSINLIKGNQKSHTASIILNGERLNVYP